MGFINELLQPYASLLFTYCLTGITLSLIRIVYILKLKGKKDYFYMKFGFFHLASAIYIFYTYSTEIKNLLTFKDCAIYFVFTFLVLIGVLFIVELNKIGEKLFHEYEGFTSIIFYPVTISKDWAEKEDYEEQRQYELAMTLNKREFETYYFKPRLKIGIHSERRYHIDIDKNVHFITYLKEKELKRLLNIKSPLGKKIQEQTEMWSNAFPDRIIDHYIIEYIGSIEYYSDYM